MAGKRKKQRRSRVDQEFLKALSHPLRVEILEVLNEREASASELEELLERPLSNVSYHCRVLHESGCIKEVRTEQRRGAVEHFFRAVPRSFVGHQELREVPRSLRGNVTAMSLQSFLDASVAAIEAGKIDGNDDTVLSWMVIGVDEVGWNDAVKLGRTTIAKFETVHEQSRSRAEKSGARLRPMLVGLAGFEAASRQAQKP